MVSNGIHSSVEEKRLRSRVIFWGAISFLLLVASLVVMFQGQLVIDIDGRPVGLGQLIWLPSLIGSCSGLWLLLTLSGAKYNLSVPIALVSLAGAEFCALTLPIEGIHGLAWNEGNGLAPSITFAALALTAITWTATGLIDPLRDNQTMYMVALTAVALVGFLLSMEFFHFLQGVMATALAAALLYGAAYDRRLSIYPGKEGIKRSGAAVLLGAFVVLPMLLIGLPYLLL